MAKKTSYKALIIEDDYEDAFIIQDQLENIEGYSFKISHFTTVEKSLEVLKYENFDIILSDLGLPDSFGIDTVKKVFDNSSNTPLIVLTGQNDHETGIAALDEGAQDFLTKGTFTGEQLFKSIQYAISRKSIEEDLRKNQNLLYSIFNDTPLVLFLVDTNREILKINRTGLDMAKTTEKVAMGQRGGDLFNCINHLNNPVGCGHGEECKTCVLRNTVNKSFENKKTYRGVSAKLPLSVKGKVNARHFQISASHIETDDKEMVLVSLNDITELEAAKTKIVTNNLRLECLLKVAEAEVNDVESYLDFSLEQAIAITESKIGYIYLYSEDLKQFRLNTWSKEVMDECKVVEKQTVYDLDKTGCWGEVVRQKKPFIINDYKLSHSMVKGTPEGHVRLKKFMSIPLFSGQQIVAVVGVANKDSDYDDTDVKELSILMDSVWKNVEKFNHNLEMEKYQENLENKVKERTAELEKAKVIAEQAAQSKSDFLANMSHEIRTPMNSIIGFTEILTQKLNDPHQKDLLTSIKTSSTTLLNLINNILDFSKIEAGHSNIRKEALALRSIVVDMKNTFNQKAIEKGIVLSTSVSEEIPEFLFIDELHVRQVLINLIGNAIKFTFSGSVDLNITADRLDKNVTDLSISVKDTGVGILEDNFNEIFESFRQVDSGDNRYYEGTGLGLAITKKLVELMGGSINVKSEPGKGSEFICKLPNIKISKTLVSRQIEKAEIDPKAIKFDPATIMVVDDVPNNIKVVKGLLEPYGFEFIEATNGDEAVKLAVEQVPDIIFLDLKMPEKNGYDAAEIISTSKITKHIPIIALTAIIFESFGKVLQNRGFKGYIRKPFFLDDLLQVLVKFLKHTYSSDSKINHKDVKDVLNLDQIPQDKLKTITSEYSEIYKSITQRYSHKQSKTFAEGLIKRSKELRIRELEEFSIEFLTTLNLFDIERIREMLKEYDKLFEEVS